MLVFILRWRTPVSMPGSATSQKQFCLSSSLVGPAGLEPETPGSEDRCSIHSATDPSPSSAVWGGFYLT